MTRQQRKTIEREFFAYPANLEKAANAAADCAYANFGTDFSEPRVKSSPAGNVAENRLIKLIGEEDLAWRWCVVYQKTFERFRWTQKDELMRRRYIERESEIKSCMEIGIARSTYYLWVEEILLAANMWAKDLGLF